MKFSLRPPCVNGPEQTTTVLTTHTQHNNEHTHTQPAWAALSELPIPAFTFMFFLFGGSIFSFFTFYFSSLFVPSLSLSFRVFMGSYASLYVAFGARGNKRREEGGDKGLEKGRG